MMRLLTVVLLLGVGWADGFQCTPRHMPTGRVHADARSKLSLAAYRRPLPFKPSAKNRSKKSVNRRLFQRFIKLWMTLKHWILVSLLERHTIYVLELQDNKYYVGSTTNKKQRFREHLKGGSKWTRRYKPLGVYKQYNRIPAKHHLGMEASVTSQMMLQKGVNNVRGAMFSEPRPYNRKDIKALTRFLGHYNDLDYKKVREKLYVELAGRRNKFRRKPKKFDSDDTCFHCGEKGHWANDCPKAWGALASPSSSSTLVAAKQ